jgi:opacity protein-like surface antigen
MTLRFIKTLPVVAVLLSATVMTAPAWAADDIYSNSSSSTTTTTMNDTAPSAGSGDHSWMPYGASGMYLAGQIGGSFPTGDLDNDVSYALALGWQFSPNIRAELEGAYRNNDFNNFTGDASTWTWMANGFYDFKNSTPFTPYVGGGIGWAYQNVNNVGFDDSDSAFVYQLGAGVSYNLTPNAALTADYRWIDTGNFNHGGGIGDDDYSAHEVRGGVRYTF